MKIFRTSISWWFSTGVWVTASLLKSQGLFLIFWPISTSCSLDGLLFPSFSAPLLILWWIYQQCQLVSRSLSCFIGFVSVLLQSLSYILSFWFLSVLPCAKQERQSLLFGRLIIFSLTFTRSGRLRENRWTVSKEYCASHSRLFLFFLFLWSNFKLLALFAVDQLPQPIVFRIILSYTTFAYTFIDSFVSITT